ncbi:MAG: queuosine transporter QueT, partial [Lactococcus sp.]
QLNKAFFYFAIFFSISMVTIALEMHFLFGMPFFWTWFTLAVGEFASLLIGAIIMDKLGKRIDLTR